jgi:hypothetical protein
MREVFLQGVDAAVEAVAYLHPEELVEHRAVEALHKTGRPGRRSPGFASWNAPAMFGNATLTMNRSRFASRIVASSDNSST